MGLHNNNTTARNYCDLVQILGERIGSAVIYDARNGTRRVANVPKAKITTSQQFRPLGPEVCNLSYFK